MAKINIEKSLEKIEKEKNTDKLELMKTKKNVTNDELKELILMVLGKLGL